MDQLIIILIPILVADILNPVLLAGTIYCLGSRQPIINTLAVLMSFLVTYFLSGIVIAIGLELLEDYFHFPQEFDYVLELLIAALLFYMAWDQIKVGDRHPEKKLEKENCQTVIGSIALGVQINLVGLPFAIPYLAAIDQILKAEINIPLILILLLVYNICYVFPYFLLLPVRLVYKRESDVLFERINNWMHRVCTRYLPIFFIILGILLIEDAVSWLIGYREYSFIRLISTLQNFK